MREGGVDLDKVEVEAKGRNKWEESDIERNGKDKKVGGKHDKNSQR